MPNIELDTSCVRHDGGNGAIGAYSVLKVARAPFPELDKYGTTTSKNHVFYKKI